MLVTHHLPELGTNLQHDNKTFVRRLQRLKLRAAGPSALLSLKLRMPALAHLVPALPTLDVHNLTHLGKCVLMGGGKPVLI